MPALEYPSPAREVRVARYGEYRDALESRRPGDHIVLADGDYDGPPVTIAGSAPGLVIRAERAGKARVPDHDVRAPGVTLWGAYFDGSQLRVRGDDVRVLRTKHANATRTAIELYGPSTGIEIGLCDLTTAPFKRGVEPEQRHRFGIAAQMDGDRDAPKKVRIWGGYFHDFSRKPTTDYDAAFNTVIRVAEDAGQCEVEMGWLIEGVLFQRCHCSVPNASGGLGQRVGMAEFKSSGNVIRNFTILDSEGFLICRQGYGNRIEDGYLRNSGGIRFYSGGQGRKGHKLANSKLVETAGGVQVMAGNALPGKKSDVQPRAEGVSLVNVESNKFDIGRQFGEHFKFPALGTRLEGCTRGGRPLTRQSVTWGLHEGSDLCDATTAKREPVELTEADVGPAAPWPGTTPQEPEQPAGQWCITWSWPGAPLWYWRHNFQGLPDFAREAKEAAKFASESEARACIDGPDRPLVVDTSKLGVAPCPA